MVDILQALTRMMTMLPIHYLQEHLLFQICLLIRLFFEYTGRPMFADDFYETCRALIWYNAECNYENNKKGLFKYFSQHNSLYLLSDTLDFLKDKELMKPGLYGNKAKGTISSAPIKAYGRRCIRDWLLKPVTVTQVIDRGS